MSDMSMGLAEVGGCTASPVSYWKLDSTSGTTATDEKGVAHGTLVNFTAPGCWVTGYHGNALKFDGNDDSVNCGAHAEHNFTTAMSLSFHIKRTNTDGFMETIISRSDGGVQQYAVLIFDGAITFLVESQNHAYVASSTIADTDWHKIAVTYTCGSGNSIKVYIDNTLSEGSWVTGDGDTYTIDNDTLVTYLGESGTIPAATLDEVYFFDTQLSEELIASL